MKNTQRQPTAATSSAADHRAGREADGLGRRLHAERRPAGPGGDAGDDQRHAVRLQQRRPGGLDHAQRDQHRRARARARSAADAAANTTNPYRYMSLRPARSDQRPAGTSSAVSTSR